MLADPSAGLPLARPDAVPARGVQRCLWTQLPAPRQDTLTCLRISGQAWRHNGSSEGSWQLLRCAACRFLAYGRQGRWSRARRSLNGRFTHLIIGNEASLLPIGSPADSPASVLRHLSQGALPCQGRDVACATLEVKWQRCAAAQVASSAWFLLEPEVNVSARISTAGARCTKQTPAQGPHLRLSPALALLQTSLLQIGCALPPHPEARCRCPPVPSAEDARPC